MEIKKKRKMENKENMIYLNQTELCFFFSRYVIISKTFYMCWLYKIIILALDLSWISLKLSSQKLDLGNGVFVESLYIKPICEIVVSDCCESNSNVPVVIQIKKATWKKSCLFFYIEYKRFILSSKETVNTTKSRQKKLISFFVCLGKINIIFFVLVKIMVVWAHKTTS